MKPRKRSEEKKSQRPKKVKKAKVVRDESPRSYSYERAYVVPYDRRHQRHPIYDDYDYMDRYAPYPHDKRGPAKKIFDSDFDQEAKNYGKKVRGGPPRPYDDDFRKPSIEFNRSPPGYRDSLKKPR